MERWTKERLENMDDFEFAAAILGERRMKTRAYTPLDTKLGEARKLLSDIAEHRRSGETRNFAEPARMLDICNRVISYLSEMVSGSDLYETLSESIGMTDEEVKKAGYGHLMDTDDDCPLSDGTSNEYADSDSAENYHFVNEECVGRPEGGAVQ